MCNATTDYEVRQAYGSNSEEMNIVRREGKAHVSQTQLGSSSRSPFLIVYFVRFVDGPGAAMPPIAREVDVSSRGRLSLEESR